MGFLKTLGRLVLMGLMVVSGTMATELCSSPAVVNDLDVARYANNQSWFEIARTKDEIFEDDLVCVHARYTPNPDGHLAVFNQGRRGTPQGEVFGITGDAYPEDPAVPAKLTVRFPSIPWGSPYWIIYVDPDYQTAIVYSCQEHLVEFSWILSRNPLMDAQTLDTLLNQADQLGIKRDYFTPVLQLGC